MDLSHVVIRDLREHVVQPMIAEAKRKEQVIKHRQRQCDRVDHLLFMAAGGIAR